MKSLFHNKDAYQAGRSACLAYNGDQSLAVCPYGPVTLNAISWALGWDDAKKQLPVMAY